jgi:hypothetical protein
MNLHIKNKRMKLNTSPSAVKNKRVMLHIIYLSPKIDVALKITIEFMIDHY